MSAARVSAPCAASGVCGRRHRRGELLLERFRIAAPDHPVKRVLAGHRQWLRDLLTALVTEAGLLPIADIVGALIVLYDGASAAAFVDGSAAMADHARWAVERLIDVSHHARPRRRDRHVARRSRRL